MNTKKVFIPLSAAFIFVCLACATFPKNENPSDSSNLSAGTVKKEIIKGQTTQAELLELFGAPNLVTVNANGEEVWNYNRMSYSTQTGSDGMSLLFAGGSRAMTTATTKSFDLILIFDENDVVKTYSVVSASY